METIRRLRGVRVLLLLLPPLAVAAVAWLIISSPAPSVKGEPPLLPQPGHSTATATPIITPEAPFNTRDVGEDQDEIDPEACATVVQKELEGPIEVTNPIFLKSQSVVVREQMIIKVIQACNVDDEIRPPNLERELDTDIEVFSIICEKALDLSVAARCEVLRVAQEDNAPFLESGGE